MFLKVTSTNRLTLDYLQPKDSTFPASFIDIMNDANIAIKAS